MLRTDTLGTIPIETLRSDLRGRVIAPGDPGYDEARNVVYGQFDRRPAVIARPADEADVARVIALARETGLELAVRSGGHSLAGYGASEGGIVLDLSAMKDLEIDVEGRTAWAQTGLTAGEYTTAVAAHGLATGFGDTASVGIGGLTLGGGIGYLVRKHGLTIDHLLAAEIVTADGQHLTASTDTNPDLFWALRGGGGNFGVVTRLKFQLHEVDPFVGGMLVLPATPESIAAFVAAANEAPDELTTIAAVMTAPPVPFLPAEAHGKRVILAMVAYAGEVEAGQRAIAPLRAVATPIADMVRPMPYTEMFQGGPEFGDVRLASRTLFIDTIDEALAGDIIEHLAASTATTTVVQIRVLGGAMARVAENATAFAHRRSRILVSFAALFPPTGERGPHEAWAESLARSLRQGEPRTFVNLLGTEGTDWIRAAYPDQTWDRLSAIKRRYDPTNLFRLNLNLPPAGGPD